MDQFSLVNFFAFVWMNLAPSAIFFVLILFVIRNFIIKPVKKTIDTARR